MAFILPHHVNTCSVITNVRMSRTFVHIQTVISAGSEEIPRMADTLEASLKVLANSVLADIWPLITLVNVHAISKA